MNPLSKYHELSKLIKACLPSIRYRTKCDMSSVTVGHAAVCKAELVATYLSGRRERILNLESKPMFIFVLNNICLSTSPRDSLIHDLFPNLFAHGKCSQRFSGFRVTAALPYLRILVAAERMTFERTSQQTRLCTSGRVGLSRLDRVKALRISRRRSPHLYVCFAREKLSNGNSEQRFQVARFLSRS